MNNTTLNRNTADILCVLNKVCVTLNYNRVLFDSKTINWTKTPFAENSLIVVLSALKIVHVCVFLFMNWTMQQIKTSTQAFDPNTDFV